jgi:MoxR-like ATPase
MEFTKTYFNPAASGGRVETDGSVTHGSGDQPGDVYVYSESTVLALNVAMATARPLLISGEPGSGKTTLALNAARVLGRWFFKETVTSRTKADDLMWRFDTLRRLNDAQTPGEPLRPRQYYVEPGRLWWAFDPVSAITRGKGWQVGPDDSAANPGIPGTDNRAVLLLDEIDKADPDVPNDLLEPFDTGSFSVRDTDDAIARQRDVLLILTTNGERELPPAFLRRCVTLKLAEPTADWLVQIAERRSGLGAGATLIRAVADEVMAWRAVARKLGVRAPGTAEFLDAVRACQDLGITTQSEAWQSVARTALWKNDKDAPVVTAQP